MGVVSAVFRGRAVTEAAKAATIYNVSVVTGGVEESQLLNANTKMFTIKISSGNATLNLAFASSASTTLTVNAGNSYTAEGLDFTGTLFFTTSTGSQTVEIIEWA